LSIPVKYKRREGIGVVEISAQPKGDNVLTQFTMDGKVYTLVASAHALDMLHKRRLNPWYIASACIALGAKLDRYNNSGKDIMIVDKAKNTTCIVTVENNTIVLITVLNKSNPYVKADAIDRTVVEKFDGVA
jgi:hypothetical protein